MIAETEERLTQVLREHADVAVPPRPLRYSEVRARIDAYRRRRVLAAGAGAAAVAVVAVVAATALVTTKPGPAPASIGDALPSSSRAVASAEVPPRFTADLAGITATQAPVSLGKLVVDGVIRTAVLFLATSSSSGDDTAGSWICTALAKPDGHVSSADPSTCTGLATPASNEPLIAEITPLGQSGLATPSCLFGPLGNLDIAVTTTAVAAASVETSDGTVQPMLRVAGTQTWPVHVFEAGIPARQFVGGYLFSDASGRSIGSPPSPAKVTDGCPKHGG